VQHYSAVKQINSEQDIFCNYRSSNVLRVLRHTATFTPHETKLTWTGLKPSLRQLLRRLWRRTQGLATPLTLFLTITLTRQHSSIVQFICCERVLTICKVRRYRRRYLTVCRWRCLLLWTLSGERAVANHRWTARRAVCELLSNTNLLMCMTLNEQQPLTFGDVYGRVQDLATP